MRQQCLLIMPLATLIPIYVGISVGLDNVFIKLKINCVNNCKEMLNEHMRSSWSQALYCQQRQ